MHRRFSLGLWGGASELLLEVHRQMQPNLIFDKSFLQRLRPAELEELTLWFRPICIPTLLSEIVADLEKPAGQDRVPESIVKALARKMKGSPGFTPCDWRALVLGELRGRGVPMNGFTVPVDAGAPTVTSSEMGVMYDAGVEQAEWARLASGEFTPQEQERAAAWRVEISEINLDAIARSAQLFIDQWLRDPRSLDDIVSGVDLVMSDPRMDGQLEVLRVALSIVNAPAEVQTNAFDMLLARPGRALSSWAPYTANAVRLALTANCGIAKSFVGGVTSQIDLQYLYYAPFCAAFVSADKLQRTLWPAVTSSASFLWGPSLQDELRERATIRSGMSIEEWAAYRRPYGWHPPPLDGSLINEVYEKVGVPSGPLASSNTKKVSDLDAETLDALNAFLASVGRDPYLDGS